MCTVRNRQVECTLMLQNACESQVYLYVGWMSNESLTSRWKQIFLIKKVFIFAQQHWVASKYVFKYHQLKVNIRCKKKMYYLFIIILQISSHITTGCCHLMALRSPQRMAISSQCRSDSRWQAQKNFHIDID